MIPPNTVRDILDAVRIEEVVEDFVSLRRRGSNLIGLCPFHHEKTPSFSVNPPRNIFKCFGCGKGGDAVTFLMELEGFTYPDALRWLARKYRIEVQEVERTPEQVAEQQAADSLYIVNDFALRHFEEQLFDTDEGKSVALSYFKKRGLREDTIRAFGLGYAPDQRDLLLQRAKAAGHNLDLLKKTGLCSQDGSRDFFRGRVMFAIHNLSGKVAAFAGRTMSADKTIPKYVNSPETEIYVKNKTLYGMFQAKKAIRKQDECILVEGYMDVISLYQAGIENVVASSGTSLTEGQVLLIKRNTPNLLIVYDGDSAGSKAAERGFEIALGLDMNVSVALLPDGDDPDTLVQKIGQDGFLKYISERKESIVTFKARQLLKEASNDPFRKLKAIDEIARIISQINDAVKRDYYEREVSQGDFQIDQEKFRNSVAQHLHRKIQKAEENRERTPVAVSDDSELQPGSHSDVSGDTPVDTALRDRSLYLKDEFQERDIVRLLVQFGDRVLAEEKTTVAELVLADIEESLGDFDNPLYGRIARECHTQLVQGQPVGQAFFVSHEAKEVRDLAIDLLSTPWEYSPNWETKWNYPLQNQPMPEQNFDTDMHKSLSLFKIRKLNKLLEKNKERLKAASRSGDETNERHFMQINIKIEQARNRIAKENGIVFIPK